MKILLINKYLYSQGGDAISNLATGKILEAHGHEVIFWGMDHPDKGVYPFADLFVSYVDYDLANRVASRARVTMNILYLFEVKKENRRLA